MIVINFCVVVYTHVALINPVSVFILMKLEGEFKSTLNL